VESNLPLNGVSFICAFPGFFFRSDASLYVGANELHGASEEILARSIPSSNSYLIGSGGRCSRYQIRPLKKCLVQVIRFEFQDN
jgi:hypothetical protein